MIDGKLCAILWWVDGIELLNFDNKVVDKLITKLKSRFGEVPEYPLTKTWGKVRDYLGMIIDYITPGWVKFTMYGYI